MGRLLSLGALACVLSFGAAVDAAATPFLDPIVRTRGGSIGSVPIDELPMFFDLYPDEFDVSFPELPSNPIFAGSCNKGSTDEFGGTLDFVACEFENTLPQAITSLSFTFAAPGYPDGSIFTPIDEDGFFASATMGPEGALFTGGAGIPGCVPDIEGGFCNPFHFLVEFYGFPEGTRMTMTVAQADAVPEPATLMLLGTGLLLAAAARRRRH